MNVTTQIINDITNMFETTPAIEKQLLIEREKSKVDLVNIFYDMYDTKNKNDFILIHKMPVSQKDIEIVKQAVSLRKNVNDYLKGVNQIECFKRNNEDRIDFQAMLVEMIFSKYLWDKYKFVPASFKKDFTIKSPEIASVFLNHDKEDFFIQYESDILNFDVKSQFLNNRYQSININQKAHKRFKEHNTDFYIVGIIDGNPEDFNSVQNVYFFLMTNNYFDTNAKAVDTSTSPRFTPYYKIDMLPFKQKVESYLYDKLNKDLPANNLIEKKFKI